MDYYKDYYMVMHTATDAKGNRTTILLDDADPETLYFDWRLMAPTGQRDANDNLSLMAYDILGMPVASAMLGKGKDAGSTEGDHLDGFVADLDDATRDAFFADPVAWAGQLLQGASARFIYDYDSTPLRVATIAREQHWKQNHDSPMQIGIEYSDGLGRVLMKKVQAEPGEFLYIDTGGQLQTGDSGTALRWVGSGRTILNNKSKPIKQYEPYFSGTPAFEDDAKLVEIGHSPIIYYDPVGRAIRTEMPNGTSSHTVFDAWQQASYDPNDNVSASQWEANILAGGIAEEMGGCMDQIFAVRQVCEKYLAKGKDVF